MAIYATFNGVNASGYINSWGLHFVTGEEVLVEDAEAVAAIKRHPEFSYREKARTNPDGSAFDHDGDGKAGGSKPKAKAPARKRK